MKETRTQKLMLYVQLRWYSRWHRTIGINVLHGLKSIKNENSKISYKETNMPHRISNLIT